MEIKECPSGQCKVEFAFYLAFVKQCSVEEDETVNDVLPQIFFRLTTMVEFDTFVSTHGPATDVLGECRGSSI